MNRVRQAYTHSKEGWTIFHDFRRKLIQERIALTLHPSRNQK